MARRGARILFAHTRGADEHQELLAAREEDRKARQAVVDVELVDAALVQPHELVAVAAELLCPLVQLVVLEAAVVAPASRTPCETTRVCKAPLRAIPGVRWFDRRNVHHECDMKASTVPSLAGTVRA